MIEIKSLRVDYENVIAVHDVDIVVEPGRIYGLVGPNGAGKTTILKAAAGLIETTYGDIKICGYDLALNPHEALREIGFMPDFNPVCENLKVWEYLEVFGLEYLVEPAERAKLIGKWMKKTGLLEKSGAFIHTLSRGMRQRLVLARTLLHDPKVIFLDEPASGLDPMGRIIMKNILKEAALEGKTIIISSHILSELSDLCDAAGIMEKGRMVVSGDMDLLRAHSGIKSEIVVKLFKPDAETKHKLFAALKSHPAVGVMKEGKKGEFYAEFSGEEDELPALLAGLTKEGLPVTQFFLKKADMEDIFFKIGAGELS